MIAIQFTAIVVIIIPTNMFPTILLSFGEILMLRNLKVGESIDKSKISLVTLKKLESSVL